MQDDVVDVSPFPDANAMLRVLLSGVHTVLGRQLVGVYLFGSLTSGHFDRASDIDVLVVTDGDISDGVFADLGAMHARIAAMDSPWAVQLEVSYIPGRDLRRHDPTRARHPHIDRGMGERLQVEHHDQSWIVQRHVLRERGITLAGPAAHILIDPISSDELRQAMLAILRGWASDFLDNPALMDSHGYQSYVVLSLCRILYTLRYGDVVSKLDAAHWAQESLGEPWAALIERAWVARRHPGGAAPAKEVRGTLAFIRYTLERGREFETRLCSSGG